MSDPKEVQRLRNSRLPSESEREVVGEVQDRFTVLGPDWKWLADTEAVDAQEQIVFVVLLKTDGRRDGAI